MKAVSKNPYPMPNDPPNQKDRRRTTTRTTSRRREHSVDSQSSADSFDSHLSSRSTRSIVADGSLNGPANQSPGTTTTTSTTTSSHRASPQFSVSTNAGDTPVTRIPHVSARWGAIPAGFSMDQSTPTLKIRDVVATKAPSCASSTYVSVLRSQIDAYDLRIDDLLLITLFRHALAWRKNCGTRTENLGNAREFDGSNVFSALVGLVLGERITDETTPETLKDAHQVLANSPPLINEIAEKQPQTLAWFEFRISTDVALMSLGSYRTTSSLPNPTTTNNNNTTNTTLASWESTMAISALSSASVLFKDSQTNGLSSNQIKQRIEMLDDETDLDIPLTPIVLDPVALYGRLTKELARQMLVYMQDPTWEEEEQNWSLHAMEPFLKNAIQSTIYQFTPSEICSAEEYLTSARASNLIHRKSFPQFDAKGIFSHREEWLQKAWFVIRAQKEKQALRKQLVFAFFRAQEQEAKEKQKALSNDPDALMRALVLSQEQANKQLVLIREGLEKSQKAIFQLAQISLELVKACSNKTKSQSQPEFQDRQQSNVPSHLPPNRSRR